MPPSIARIAGRSDQTAEQDAAVTPSRIAARRHCARVAVRSQAVPAEPGQGGQPKRGEREQLRRESETVGSPARTWPAASRCCRRRLCRKPSSRIGVESNLSSGPRSAVACSTRANATSRQARASPRSGSCTGRVPPRALTTMITESQTRQGGPLRKASVESARTRRQSTQVERRHPDLRVDARESGSSVPSRCFLRIVHPRRWARSFRPAGSGSTLKA